MRFFEMRLPNANLFFWLGVYVFLPIIPVYYSSIGISVENIGIMMGAFSLGSIIMRPLAGAIADIFGTNRVIQGGMALSFLSLLGIFLFFDNYPVATCFRFFYGIGSGAYSSAAILLVTIVSPKEKMKSAVGLYTLCSMIGLGLATSSALRLYDLGGMVTVSSIALASTIISYFFIPFHASSKATKNKKNRIEICNIIFGFFSVLKNKFVIAPFLCLLLIYMVYGYIITFTPAYFKLNSGVDISLFYYSYSTFVILTRISINAVDKFFHDFKLPLYLIVFLEIALLLPIFSQKPIILLFMGAILGGGIGLATPLLTVLVAQNVSIEQRGKALAVFGMAIDIGFAFGPMLMGAIVSNFNYVSGLVFLIILLFIFSIYYAKSLYKIKENVINE